MHSEPRAGSNRAGEFGSEHEDQRLAAGSLLAPIYHQHREFGVFSNAHPCGSFKKIIPAPEIESFFNH